MDHYEIRDLVKKELVSGIIKTQDFYVIGNWKMNKTKREVIDFLDQVASYDFGSKNHVGIIPSNPYLYLFEQKLRYSKIAYGVQNVHFKESGAFTGEISYKQALDFGSKYAIIGHSERRNIFNECNVIIGQKVKSCVNNHLKPILCIGEDLEKRENDTYKDFLYLQIIDALSNLTPDELKKVIIAYEPIWAIGTGVTATPTQVEQTHVFIKNVLANEYGEVGKNIPILYGGSVKPSNVLELALAEGVSGFLIGGASLEADSFIEINNKLNGK